MGRGFPMLVLCMFNYLLTVYSNAELDALLAWKSNLSDPNHVLTTWDNKTENPCTWFHVTCNTDNIVTRIDLGDYNLSGQLVPQLGSLQNLMYLELYGNSISGKIPPELGNLKNLVSLDLYMNKISGPIPDELGNLSQLRFLRLNNNTLSGTIPMTLTTIVALQVLDMSFNNLSGIIPVNGSFALFTMISFLGNPYLKAVTASGSTTYARGTGITGAIAGGIAAAAAALSLAAFATALVCWRRRKDQDNFFDISAEEDCEEHVGQLPRFSFRELQIATDNFDPKNVVGAGGFGKVYKGLLADGTLVAIKRLKHVHNKVEELQFQTEVDIISLVVHRNLLHLIGFCMTPTEKLLVYPYMANGSVASCLRARQGSEPLLDWPKRKQVALGSARGLAHLHHQSDPRIIHRDVKAENILLDDEFEAVVGDFGLAKLMGNKKTHVTTAVRGTIGHIAPEYFTNGKCSEKADIFGYGVMLLELVSGQKATNLAQIAIDEGFVLLDWVKGHLMDKKLERLVDDNLQGNYIQVEVEHLIQVALLCIQSFPMQRPTMLELLKMLEGDGLAERWAEWEKQKLVYQESNNTTIFPNGGWVVDSTSELRPDELSGPR